MAPVGWYVEASKRNSESKVVSLRDQKVILFVPSWTEQWHSWTITAQEFTEGLSTFPMSSIKT